MEYDNEILNYEKNITNVELDDFEKTFQIKLPVNIRKHYLSYNGGEPKKYIYNGYSLQFFYSFKYGEYTIEETLTSLRDDGLIPLWLVPIGEDPGGDIYCCSLKVDEEGSIYIWRSDDFDPDNLESAITYVADSITTFINGMTEDIED